MFCSNCGREIGDNSKFCNFCGLPISQPVSQPLSQPISQPVLTVETTENQSEPITESEETVQSVRVTSPEPPSSVPIYSAPRPENIPNMGTTAAPQPENIPNAGVTVTPQQYNNTATPQAPIQDNNIVEKPMPERKYTLGHIIMCLAAVAVMAVVAGIFAGLYFAK